MSLRCYDTLTCIIAKMDQLRLFINERTLAIHVGVLKTDLNESKLNMQSETMRILQK